MAAGGALLRLLRWPGILTAAADAACASWLLYCTPAKTASCALAAGLVYAGGVVLNDVADAGRDAVLHPDRPIPRGEVARRPAALFGLALLGAGGVAAFPAGEAALVAFLGVAAAALLYDFLLKRWGFPGAVGMGLCRGGSVLAAALSSPGYEERFRAAPWTALLLPLPWFLHAVAVTATSLLEEGKGRRLVPLAAAGILLPTAVAIPVLRLPRNPAEGLALIPAALLTLCLGRILARRNPCPAALVREGIFGFLLLDATVLALRGSPVAAGAALLLWGALRLLLAGRRS